MALSTVRPGGGGGGGGGRWARFWLNDQHGDIVLQCVVEGQPDYNVSFDLDLTGLFRGSGTLSPKHSNHIHIQCNRFDIFALPALICSIVRPHLSEQLKWYPLKCARIVKHADF